jgi:hypothetical protein
MELQLQDMRMAMPNGAVVYHRLGEPRSGIVGSGRFFFLPSCFFDSMLTGGFAGCNFDFLCWVGTFFFYFRCFLSDSSLFFGGVVCSTKKMAETNC